MEVPATLSFPIELCFLVTEQRGESQQCIPRVHCCDNFQASARIHTGLCPQHHRPTSRSSTITINSWHEPRNTHGKKKKAKTPISHTYRSTSRFHFNNALHFRHCKVTPHSSSFTSPSETQRLTPNIVTPATPFPFFLSVPSV